MIERHKRKDEAKPHPVGTGESYKNLENLKSIIRVEMKAATYTLRVWHENGELKKSEEVPGPNIYRAIEQVD